MSLGLVAPWAVLLQLKAIWSITTVLLGNVVTLLAHLAGEGDLRANVLRLASHGIFLTFGGLRSGCFNFDIG